MRSGRMWCNMEREWKQRGYGSDTFSGHEDFHRFRERVSNVIRRV